MLAFSEKPTPVDIEALASQHSLALMQRIAPPPSGRRRGNEYQLLNSKRDDKTLGSFSINLQTALWAGFTIDLNGYSFISIVEYLYDLSSTESFNVVGGVFGLWDVPHKLQEPFNDGQLHAAAQM